MRDPFDTLYEVRHSDFAPFSEHYVGPPLAWRIERATPTLIASYKRESCDGQDVDVYCTAMPARFYSLHVMAGERYDGEPKPACKLNTGSGMAEWAAQTAKLISQGMVTIDADA